MRRKNVALLVVLPWLGLFCNRANGTPPVENRFMEGYITGVLQVQFHITGEKVIVERGTIVLDLPKQDASQQRRVRHLLTKIAHGRRIKIIIESAHQAVPAHTGFGPATTMPAIGNMPSEAPGSGPSAPLPGEVSLQPPAGHRNLYRLPTGAFPAGRLFTPLLADPRWPGFSAEYEHFSPYHPISGLKDVIQVSIGDTVPLDRKNLPDDWQMEYGLQATVFAFFNTDTIHSDLQNADYFVGGYAAFRHKNLSFILRYYHQSSHLGDELLVDDPQYLQLRQKISYEEINAIGSVDFYHRMFRIYAGGGYLLDVAPADLGHWRVHYGVEFHGPMFMRLGFLRVSPVAGADFKNWDQTNWDTDVSLRAGIQIEKNRLTSPKMQFLLEFYNGHDQNGQFYVNKVQYIGFGVHYYF